MNKSKTLGDIFLTAKLNKISQEAFQTADEFVTDDYDLETEIYNISKLTLEEAEKYVRTLKPDYMFVAGLYFNIPEWANEGLLQADTFEYLDTPEKREAENFHSLESFLRK
tara:strand:- start:380 stop:712 length:333 start_codon:yes stop_codon:yes gene_type:complete